MKLLAIDGNSIINRAFYGIRLLSTKDGRFTNAVYGFINILNKLMEIENPDGVAVAFDLKAPTFRHKKYAEYKAGRKPMPEELRGQFPILKEWLRLAGYSVVECEGYEADDILGTLADICEKSGNHCAIATGDRDSLQLISDKTHILLAHTKMGKPEIIDYTPEVLFEKYGLTPNEMIDLKALMGDSSDNIPGVAGIGEKTATDLISRYHSIDYIYEHIDELDVKEGIRTKLINGKDSAYLSRWVGTICKEAPIDGDINNYLIKPRDNRLGRLMTELEFFSLMDKMGVSPTAEAENESGKCEIFTVKDYNGETFENCDIYISGDSCAVVSDKTVYKADKIICRSLFLNKNTKKRVYDYKEFSKEFPECEGVAFDLKLASYLLNPSSPDYSVERLTSEYSVTPQTETDDVFLKDAAAFSLLCDKLYSKLDESGELKLLTEIELPLARVLGEMETVGFLVDKEGIEQYGGELSEKITELQEEIYSLANEKFNINSPKQLGEILFVKMGLPAKKKTKSGFSTNAEVLEELRYDYPIVDYILKYRQLAKLKSTYCDGLLNAISSDGRIHTTFNQTEARTGRISSLEPNLQNIPIRTDEGKKLRRFFTAKEGSVLIDADYSQIELRVLADISGDGNMISAFNSGADIHTITASEVFDIPESMVLPIMRSRAKAVNFGIVYGIGAFSLAKDIGVTRAEADRYIKGYLATYPKVAEYMENVIKQAKIDGYVTTAFGRRRYLPELSASNGMLRAFGERVARNAPIQGTAADIIKIAMIRVNNRLKSELKNSRLILQVHDELIVESDISESEKAKIILTEEMENAAKLSVKLSVDANIGKNWLEAKG